MIPIKRATALNLVKAWDIFLSKGQLSDGEIRIMINGITDDHGNLMAPNEIIFTGDGVCPTQTSGKKNR